MRHAGNILVTGVGGFIGLPAATALSETGAAVIGLDLQMPEQRVPFEFVLGDFCNQHRVYRIIEERRIDTIVHIGGVSGPMLARDDPYAICRANVIGTIDLLEAARVMQVERFVYCSSASAYGDTPPAPVPDDPPLRATDVYSATKGAADLLLRAYRVQHGLDAVSLRISNGYGPRRRTRCALRTMIENGLDGRPTHMDWGGGYGRAYLYVTDAVRAIVAAVAAPEFGQWCYNIAGREFRQMEEIAAIVRGLIPGAAITMQPGVDAMGYRREALDIAAAGRDLGWQPVYDLERGIAEYIEWFKTQRAQVGA